MNDLFSIGEFSRTTHLSVKALRHYHDVGLLEPVTVDPTTGYRCYSVAQVPAGTGHPSPARLLTCRSTRCARCSTHPRPVTSTNATGLVLEHLHRMEEQLEQTQASVASLRALLEGSQSELTVEYQTVAAMSALAIVEHVSWDDAESWLSVAFDALHSILPADARCGPDGALYGNEFFEMHIGEVVAFIPVVGPVVGGDRAELLEIPAATLAVTVHEGPFDELDRTYAALGSYVAGRAIGVAGPIRERYLVSEADNPAELRTEVGWPVSTDQ